MIATPTIARASTTLPSEFQGKPKESLLVADGAKQLKELVAKLERGLVSSSDYGREFMATINMPVYQARMDELLKSQPEVVSKLAKLDASGLSQDVLAIRSFKVLRKEAPKALATITGELYTQAGFPADKVRVMVQGMFQPEAMKVAVDVISSMHRPEDSRAQQTRLAAGNRPLALTA